MRKFLFLISWVQDSESARAAGENTRIRKQSDLLLSFYNGSQYVFAVVISMPKLPEQFLIKDMDLALKAGYASAFFAGYTATDTLSDIFEVDKKLQASIDKKKLQTIVL